MSATTPKPIRCWAVYCGTTKKPYHIDCLKPKPIWTSDLIIPGRFVPDAPQRSTKKRK